jgi:phospholipid/cholesterol/gamma-HCH transport system substrate-binding protein
LPSQKQLRWSELRVGITVIVASVTLAILVFLMSGKTGFFTTRITLVTYFDDAEGLRNGQPVDLQGVAIGNVQLVHITSDPKHADMPIEVVMRINKKFQPFVRQDARATILTAGVLGESFIDINNRGAVKGPVVDGSILPSTNAPGLQDVVRSSQGTLENLDILVKRMDRIVANVESGKGTVGELLNDPTMVNKANAILNQFQALLNSVSSGKGTIGRLLSDEELANKFSDAVDKLDRIVTETQSGKNNVGKILNDESLYKNLHQTVATANQLMQDVNAGKGPLGKMVKDEAFAKKLDDTVTKLSSIADRLDAGEGSAGKFLRDPSFYNNTDQLLIESRNLVKSIRENPKKYLTIHMRIF